MATYYSMVRALKNQYSEDIEVNLKRGWFNFHTGATLPFTHIILVDMINMALEYADKETYDLLCIVKDIVSYITEEIDIYEKDIGGTSIYSICHEKGLEKVVDIIQKNNNMIV